jgi:hypothetical protein
VILPGPERLPVEREKIVDYLLNPNHRYSFIEASARRALSVSCASGLTSSRLQTARFG